MFAESNVVNKIFLCVPEFEIITVYNMGIRYLQCLLWDYCIMEKKKCYQLLYKVVRFSPRHLFTSYYVESLYQLMYKVV